MLFLIHCEVRVMMLKEIFEDYTENIQHILLVSL